MGFFFLHQSKFINLFYLFSYVKCLYTHSGTWASLSSTITYIINCLYFEGVKKLSVYFGIHELDHGVLLRRTCVCERSVSREHQNHILSLYLWLNNNCVICNLLLFLCRIAKHIKNLLRLTLLFCKHHHSIGWTWLVLKLFGFLLIKLFSSYSVPTVFYLLGMSSTCHHNFQHFTANKLTLIFTQKRAL